MLRTVRLQALRQDPDAFGSTLQRELQFDEQKWRSRLVTSRWFAVFEGEAPCGIVACMPEEGANVVQVLALWVAPQYRGRGVVDELIQAVVASGRRSGIKRLLIWVMEDNGRAKQFYDRLRFRPTGRRSSLDRDPARMALEMALEF
ncbi:MAG: GNAT family N-acetyltransferase [Thermaerobacter sp.]|nr:GNAT family N-acetyltransferase [Thermaerobacter sp.]